MNPETRKNCWEVMGCGFGPGTGSGTICPAVTEIRLHNVHGGINAGRACWVIAGTLCHGDAGGKFSRKMETCFRCPFYRQVHLEEPVVRSHQELLLRSSHDSTGPNPE